MERHEVIKGDSYTLQWTFTYKTDGSAFDPSSFDFWFTVKEDFTDLDAAAEIQKTTSDFTVSSNVVSLILSPSDTKFTPGSYWFDFQVKNGSDIRTLSRGQFIVKSEVTISG